MVTSWSVLLRADLRFFPLAVDQSSPRVLFRSMKKKENVCYARKSILPPEGGSLGFDNLLGLECDSGA